MSLLKRGFGLFTSRLVMATRKPSRRSSRSFSSIILLLLVFLHEEKNGFMSKRSGSRSLALNLIGLVHLQGGADLRAVGDDGDRAILHASEKGHDKVSLHLTLHLPLHIILNRLKGGQTAHLRGCQREFCQQQWLDATPLCG